ncbi:hypothetical protein JW805_06185 [Roseomonas aeriglobus]|nr:hypothetical protein [Roseomonas aeriglobus]
MRWWFLVAAAVALFGCAHSVAPTQRETRSCALTLPQKLANASLSFGDFDQSNDHPATAASLSARGCHAAAAEAGQDYLARRNDLPERLRTSVLFHVARNLAMAGRNDEAATAALGAVRDDGGSDPAFDWNAYVLGTWAFLKRDRALLEAKLVRLRSLQGHANVTNARVLDGLARCFSKPYAEAATPACQRP